MGRPSNRDERRAQIVEGLMRVILREGLRGATTARIAQEAGLSSGLVHYHFKRKHDVVLEVVNLLLARLNLRVAALDEAAVDAPTRLWAWLEACASPGPGADPKAVACWIAIASEAAVDSEVREAFELGLSTLESSLHSRVAEALAFSGAPSTAAASISKTLLVSLLGGFFLGSAAPGLVSPGFLAPLLVASARAHVNSAQAAFGASSGVG